jgi:predicted dehydrogenase
MLKSLGQSVQQIINEGRIGSPVFVRCVAHVAPERAQLSACLNEVIATTTTWMGAPVERMYALGSADAGQLTAVLQFERGQTALVSVGVAPNADPTIDLMVLGNRGAAYYQGFWVLGSGFWEMSPRTQNPEPRTRNYGVLLVAGRRTHQENYAACFAADPRCRLVAVTDEEDVPPERATLNEQLAQDFGVPYVRRLDEALARDDVHIVSLCVETERRGRVGVRCAEAGKHLYLDKPLAGSVEDADAIAAAVEKAGVKSQMFSCLHAPWARAAKRAVAEGAVGELLAVHCDVLFAKGRAGTAPVGTKRKEKPTVERFTFHDAKRELFDIGVYAVGLVRWLTGREARTVFGSTTNYFFREHVERDIEDFGLLAMTLDDDITATITGGRIGFHSHPKGGPQRVCLVGTKGVLTFDAYQPRLEVYADEPDAPPPSVNPDDPMSMWRSTQPPTPPPLFKRRWVSFGDERTWSLNDASNFLDCIESGRESEMTARDAAELVKVLMAGYQSAASGDVVTLKT